MRKSIVLNVNPAVAEFIHNQQGEVDPSAYVNQLLRQDMQRRGVIVDPQHLKRFREDEITQGLELMMDENTHSGE